MRVASSNVIIRHASYGLDLIDALTGEALIGPNEVSLREIGAPPITPGLEPVAFVVNRSRWVFEDLDHDVAFSINADFYLGEDLAAGVDLPPVPLPSAPGTLVTVTMKPRTGYPFPCALTRAVGAVRVDPTLDPTSPIVPGALVTVTPIHSFSPLITGATFVTKTADDGQYVVWFLPDPSLEPATAIAFDASASAVIEIAGVPTPVSGGVTNQPLVPQSWRGAETIEVS